MDLPGLVLGRLGLPPGKEWIPQLGPAGWMGMNRRVAAITAA